MLEAAIQRTGFITEALLVLNAIIKSLGQIDICFSKPAIGELNFFCHGFLRLRKITLMAYGWVALILVNEAQA